MTQAIRMLLAEGIISREQFEIATLHQAKNGGTIGGFLVDKGIVDDEDLVRFLARRFPIPHWPRRRLAGVSPHVIGLLPAKAARSLRVLPLMKDSGRVIVGVTDPTAGHALKEAARHLGAEITPVIISERDMSWALDTYYSGLKQTDEEPAPILLTQRKVRKPSPLRPVSDAPPTAEGKSIEEAIRAIPLVNKIPPKPRRGAETMRQMYTKPPPPMKRTPEVEAKIKPTAAAALPRSAAPAYDSWSKPAGPVAPDVQPEQKEDSPAPVQSEALSGKLSTPPDRPGRKLTEGELIAAINKASDRDTIIALALEALSRCAKRAIFLVVKRGEIRGFDVIGEFTSKQAAKTFWVPADTPSTFSRVAKRRQIHVGPLDRTPADAVLAASLGGRPDIAVVIPIVIKDRAVGILYADRLDIKLPPKHRLEKLATTVAENLSKIMRKPRN